jgi:hypothetical protein
VNMFHPMGADPPRTHGRGVSSTQRGYDLLAPKFDYTPFRTPDAVLEAVAAYLRPGAPFESGLDLCAGTGAGMAMLRPLLSAPLCRWTAWPARPRVPPPRQNAPGAGS